MFLNPFELIVLQGKWVRVSCPKVGHPKDRVENPGGGSRRTFSEGGYNSLGFEREKSTIFLGFNTFLLTRVSFSWESPVFILHHSRVLSHNETLLDFCFAQG